MGKALRSLRAIHGARVAHKNVRTGNMLLNVGINEVMMIDFERASILEPSRHPLAQVVPNKRDWRSGSTCSSRPVNKSSKQRYVTSALSEEIAWWA